MTTAMLGGIRWTTAAAMAFTEDQGIDNLIELRCLTDDKPKRTASVIRKPGGGENCSKISAVAEDCLKLAVYYTKHKDRIMKPLAVTNVNLDPIRAIIRQHDLKVSASIIERDSPPKIDPDDMPKLT